jgi:ribonuclease D
MNQNLSNLKFVGITICKKRQVSNWERRPLKPTQLHYGIVDSYILVIIYEELKKKAVKISLF